MQKELKTFIKKSIILFALLSLVVIIFKFPIDYFHIKLLSSDSANRLFSKTDALKVLAIAIVFFTMLYKEKIGHIKHEKNNIPLSIVLSLLGITAVASYYLIRYITNINNITAGFNLYLVYLLSIISLAAASFLFLSSVFTLKYIKAFYKKLKKELLIGAVLTIITYILLMWFQSLWPYFSYNITMILYSLFRPFFPVYLGLGNQAPLLSVNGFAVSIGAPCSGTESMFLFALFSLGIFILDKSKIIKSRFYIATILGLIGVYFVNILRLFLLILTGIYINPEFAVGMFHSNIGWLLFVIYFLIYYYVIRRFIYKRDIPDKRNK